MYFKILFLGWVKINILSKIFRREQFLALSKDSIVQQQIINKTLMAHIQPKVI